MSAVFFFFFAQIFGKAQRTNKRTNESRNAEAEMVQNILYSSKTTQTNGNALIFVVIDGCEKVKFNVLIAFDSRQKQII